MLPHGPWRSGRFWLLLLVLLLVAVGVGAGRRGLTRGQPAETGRLRLPALDAPVTVRRDAGGVPLIRATSAHDAYVALGVVHAQDRLWQMDLQRRAALGRLSELLGPPTLPADRFFRTLGLDAAVQRDWAALSPDARAAIEAYTAGVNAAVAALPALPLEYRVLDVAWEPWQPTHTLAVLKMVQWEAAGDWETELLRAGVARSERAGALAPFLDLTGVAAPPDVGVPDLVPLSEALATVGIARSHRPGTQTHEAWALDGTHTATGRPLLATASTLGGPWVDRWYAVALHAPGLDVAGGTLPGVPAVLAGHNAALAWAVVPLATDTQDWFIEEDASRATRRETIRVRGDEPVTLTVQEGTHGPLLGNVIDGLTRPLSLRWQAAVQPSTLFDAIHALGTAATPAELAAALQPWDEPVAQVVFASAGGVGTVTVGHLPQREGASAQLPQAGETWVGTRSLLDVAPSRDGVAYAPAPSAPHHAALAARDDWTADEMAARLADAEGGRYARALVERLAALPSDDVIVQRAQEQLATWNGQMRGDLPGAGLFAVAHRWVVREMLGDELEEPWLTLFQAHPSAHVPLVAALLDDPTHVLWDDLRTPERETRDDILRRALAGATLWIGRRFGDVPHEWFWYRLAPPTNVHPLARTAPWGPLFSRQPPLAGTGTTLPPLDLPAQLGYPVPQPPTLRLLLDVGAWDAGGMLHAGGQSGHPLDPHFDDMLPTWRQGALWPLGWQNGTGTDGAVLQLVP